MTENVSVEDLTDHGHAALVACRWSLHRVTEADLARPTPCAEFTVADLADHLVKSMVLLAGSAGTELVPPEASMPAERILPLAEAALSAWAARGFDGEVPLGRRTAPAADVYSIVLLELVVHGWDLARALGHDELFDVPDPVVAHLSSVTPGLIRPEARGRGFADVVEVGSDATPLQRLIAFTGRTP
jgi:uncharacterized protein (TIGR03086 family)